jgi:uncharacterized damage-inducible protein DinB
VNDGLLDAFRHNAWAMREVLRTCQGLNEEQLALVIPGTFGSVIDTLRHTINAEAAYYRRLSGEEPEWKRRAEGQPSVGELLEFNDDLAARWERFLAIPFDAERTFIIPWHDDIHRAVPAGVVLVQALHHGNEHRTQVCTTLSANGITPPQLGVWEFAEATNRAPRQE